MEKMNQNYICPNCGKTGVIEQVVPVLSDVRYDSLRCSDCGSVWRVYYKVTDMNTEIMYVPQPDTSNNASVVEAPAEEVTAEVVDNA